MTALIFPRGAAVFSPCGAYRYRLERTVTPQLERVVAFIMLNPSTATEHVDDPTIRRCIGFARSWDAGRLVIGNLFALRATDPRVMKAHAEPVGPDNDQHLLAVAREAHLVVCAWGNHGAHRGRAREVVELLRGAGAELHSLRITKAGQPEHPLYQAADTPPTRWAA